MVRMRKCELIECGSGNAECGKKTKSEVGSRKKRKAWGIGQSVMNSHFRIQISVFLHRAQHDDDAALLAELEMLGGTFELGGVCIADDKVTASRP